MQKNKSAPTSSCCPSKNLGPKKTDWVMNITLILSGVTLLYYFANAFSHGGHSHHDVGQAPVPMQFAHHFVMLLKQMSWGLALGIVMVGLLDKVPDRLVLKIMGPRPSTHGLIRASIAGVLFDLCNHGLLMVAMKLYKKGLSLPQVMAFLIASPWNSLSLTFVLVALIGLKLTLLFIVLSTIVAFISGWIFAKLIEKDVLPVNPQAEVARENYENDKSIPWSSFFAIKKISLQGMAEVLKNGVLESKIIFKWLLFGSLIASFLNISMSMETFQTYFGPGLMGMALTTIMATILEVCSEGSSPIAADIVNRAGAAGNGFVFLMTGVSTDYTEILTLKETTGSLKIALFLPLVTLPQVLILGYLLNVAY